MPSNTGSKRKLSTTRRVRAQRATLTVLLSLSEARFLRKLWRSQRATNAYSEAWYQTRQLIAGLLYCGELRIYPTNGGVGLTYRSAPRLNSSRRTKRENAS